MRLLLVFFLLTITFVDASSPPATVSSKIAKLSGMRIEWPVVKQLITPSEMSNEKSETNIERKITPFFSEAVKIPEECLSLMCPEHYRTIMIYSHTPGSFRCAFYNTDAWISGNWFIKDIRTLTG